MRIISGDMMKALPFGFQKWSGEVKQYFRADLLAGLTLWAMIVPEAVAYADLSNAPTAAAGLYGIIFVLPIYALFASSRYVVATSTSAISVTVAGFLAVMSSAEGVFSALVLAAAIAYLLFYFFKLGFIADFISEPVSRGFMFGLSLFIIIGQVPKLFGVEKTEGNSFQQAWGIIQNLPNANWVAFGFAIFIFLILFSSEKISKKIPGGLIAIAVTMLICYAVNAESRWSLDMVGALPAGLPKFTFPSIQFSDLAVLIPASIGLVILGSSESTVLAQTLAMKHNQEVDVDQQFFAFGAANLVGGFFGALLGTGSTSSTLVDHDAGAKTLMSTVWASAVTVLTVLFLTGLFAYLPEVFLGVLIIHAVYHMLKLREILDVRKYSRGEYYLAAIALFSVLLFDVLNGLILAMLLNLIYVCYKTARAKVVRIGYLKDSPYSLMPLGFSDDVQAPAKDVLAIALESGQIYYASARSAFNQASELIEKHPDANKIVISLSRMDSFDFSSHKVLEEFEAYIKSQGKTLYITDVHNSNLWKQIQDAGFDPDVVKISTHLDLSKL